MSSDIMGKDPEGNTVEFGHLVAPNTDGVDHDHFFSFRLDMDVDGPKNNFEVDKLVQYKLPADERAQDHLGDEAGLHRHRRHWRCRTSAWSIRRCGGLSTLR